MSEFSNKRIDYYNNWPNVKKFEIEQEYCKLVEEIKQSQNIFIPFVMTQCDDENFNITLSFIIDALETLEVKPNHSFEFMFKGFDNISKKIYSEHHAPTENLTDIIKWLSSYLASIFQRNTNLAGGFGQLINKIPLKSCQYLYLKINEPGSKLRGRLNNNPDFNNNVIDKISDKYGSPDFSRYENSIRKPSLLYKRYLLKGNSFQINSDSFSLNRQEVIFLLLSGYIYSLRNDSLHGSNMSITKSSKTSLATYANSFFAFILLYYVVMIIFIEKYYDGNPELYARLINNMEENCLSYNLIFGSVLDK